MATTADLIRAYVAAYNRLRLAAAVAAASAWDRYAGPADDQLDAYVAAAVRTTLAAQAQTAAMVDGYMATLAEASALGITLRYPRPADPAEVYRRAGITLRKALSDGKPYADGFAHGRARAASTAATDVSLAQRAATDEVVGRQSRIVGYRRVLTGRSCALCATASTQRYRSGKLMSVHPACDCGVAPIIGSRDPGQVVNRDLLRSLKDSGGSRYWKDRGITVDEDGTILKGEKPLDVTVHEHGELGPTLADADHGWTGPSDLVA